MFSLEGRVDSTRVDQPGRTILPRDPERPRGIGPARDGPRTGPVAPMTRLSESVSER